MSQVLRLEIQIAKKKKKTNNTNKQKHQQTILAIKELTVQWEMKQIPPRGCSIIEGRCHLFQN